MSRLQAREVHHILDPRTGDDCRGIGLWERAKASNDELKTKLSPTTAARFLQVDREFLKDPLAQGPAQASALIAAMIEQFRRGVAPYERACIVFDGLDRPGVESSIIELMEQMIGTVLQGSLAGLRRAARWSTACSTGC